MSLTRSRKRHARQVAPGQAPGPGHAQAHSRPASRRSRERTARQRPSTPGVLSWAAGARRALGAPDNEAYFQWCPKAG
eukprot:7002234-Pyramimonas_sp.AAC.1